MKDYNSHEDYAEEINAEDVPVLDEDTIKAWILITLLFLSTIAFITFIAYHYLSEYNLIQKVL